MSSPARGIRGPLPPHVQERNREIVAERLGWPDEALGACREIEAGAAGWYCWWTPLPWPDPGFRPAYGAARIDRRPVGDPSLYARTPGELAELIKAASADREASRHA
jgi:hypothetical protein